jgi:hypothetical protein
VQGDGCSGSAGELDVSRVQVGGIDVALRSVDAALQRHGWAFADPGSLARAASTSTSIGALAAFPASVRRLVDTARVVREARAGVLALDWGAVGASLHRVAELTLGLDPSAAAELDLLGVHCCACCRACRCGRVAAVAIRVPALL